MSRTFISPAVDGSRMGSVRSRRIRAVASALVALCLITACFPVAPNRGGGRADFTPPRPVDPDHVALPAGYAIDVVATGLDFPVGVAFDAEGTLHVVEAGYSYGEVFAEPRLLRMGDDGTPTTVATGDNPPWNGVDYANGDFFIAEGGQLEGGRLLRVGADGEVTVLAEGLPSMGDHHTNGPVVGPDGMIYFGQGTATNAGVVGVDNADFGWLHRFPTFHDVPCEDVTLAGVDYVSANPLTPEGDDEAVTGAYSPFGQATAAGQRIAGQLPCNGSVMRVSAQGGELELVAWGFRNPFGLAFDGQGRLFVSDNGYDARGSRQVFGAGDLLWLVEEGSWYGWPDYHGQRPLSDDEHFTFPGQHPPGALLTRHPAVPPAPVARLGVHSSSNGLDVAGEPFGFEGDVFIAQFGDMTPGSGKVVAPVGFKVVRVDPETGVVEDFAVNRAPGGPASFTGTAGLERPVAVRFSPDGSALYIVDFGVMTISDQGPMPRLGTGVIWRVTREQSR